MEFLAPRRKWAMQLVALTAALAGFAGPASAVPFVDIQPVQICTDAGTNCGGLNYDADALKAFWLNQAGLHLNFLPSRTFNSSTYQTIDAISEANTLVITMNGIDPAGPTDYSSGPITFWFSNGPGGPGQVEVALMSANRTWVDSIIDPDTLKNIDLVTIVFAHALGHNLGLSHDATLGSIMAAVLTPDTTLDDYLLSGAQKAQIFTNPGLADIIYDAPEVTETPLPPAVLLFGTVVAAGGLVRRWRRRHS